MSDDKVDIDRLLQNMAVVFEGKHFPEPDAPDCKWCGRKLEWKRLYKRGLCETCIATDEDDDV
jgi:hypothetical protein